MKIFLVAVFLSLGVLNVEGFFTHSKVFRRRRPPIQIAEDANMSAIKTLYVTQKLDNFNPDPQNRTFQMRYITNDQFFKEGGPIFIMLGGEGKINNDDVIGGHMYEIGKDVNAFLMSTEHRYYGLSKPTPNTTAKNLKYLNVDQALRDVVELVKQLKTQDHFAKSKVIVFGGSYAGNMATWIRLKYPEVIDGAMASSAPVNAKADFYEYLETVSDSILTYGGKTCWKIIRDGIKEIEKLLKTENGTAKVSKLFRLCSKLNTSEPLDVQTFYEYVITNVPTDLSNACDLMAIEGSTPVEKFAKFIISDIDFEDEDDCLNSKYSSLYKNRSDDDYDTDGTLWDYQTCNEFGYYTTTNSKKHPFGQKLPLSYYTENMCPDLFGPEFNTESVNNRIQRVNQVYQGLNPKVTKVFSIHGTVDPWHRLGIVKDLSEDSPAILVNGSSHCADLDSSSTIDNEELILARQKAREHIIRWVLE